MTSETRQAQSGFHRPQSRVRAGDATVRSEQLRAEAEQLRAEAEQLGTEAGRAVGPRMAARRAAAARSRGERPGLAGAIPYLAVLVCFAAGVYVAWHEGSHGGGRGGAIAGAALLVAAIVRLLLPARLAGLLASRHRVTDVLTLTVFGGGLLIAGLVLPRLGPLSAIRGEWLARR
jgi:Protein of unknown function (DUF3017)